MLTYIFVVKIDSKNFRGGEGICQEGTGERDFS